MRTATRPLRGACGHVVALVPSYQPTSPSAYEPQPCATCARLAEKAKKTASGQGRGRP
jgi:hypothetical protein